MAKTIRITCIICIILCASLLLLFLGTLLARAENLPQPTTATVTLTVQKDLRAFAFPYNQDKPVIDLWEQECITRSDTQERKCVDTRVIQVRYSSGKTFPRTDPMSGQTGPTLTHDDIRAIVKSLYLANQ